MYLRDLELNFIDRGELVNELLAEVEKMGRVSETETKSALAEMYSEAVQATRPFYYKSAAISSLNDIALDIDKTGNKIWEQIRNYVCRVLSKDSNATEIITAIINAVVAIIPGGIIIKLLIKIIVKFFLDNGYVKLCPVR